MVSQGLQGSVLYLTEQRQVALKHGGRNEDVGSLRMVYNVAGFVLVWFCIRCPPGNSNPDCMILIFSKVDGDLNRKRKSLIYQHIQVSRKMSLSLNPAFTRAKYNSAHHHLPTKQTPLAWSGLYLNRIFTEIQQPHKLKRTKSSPCTLWYHSSFCWVHFLLESEIKNSLLQKPWLSLLGK